jgi:hypothetical protein
LAEALPDLRHFDISRLPITDETVQRLSKHQNLAILVLNDTKITDRALDNLLTLDHLEWLYISDTQISEAGLLRFLKHAKAQRNLLRLGAKSVLVTDEICSSIARLDRIEIVDLENTLLTDKGLKELEKCPSLVEVWIGGCSEVTKSGVDRLRSSLPDCKVFSSFDAR